MFYNGKTEENLSALNDGIRDLFPLMLEKSVHRLHSG
jgi:hypothetical protein